MSTTMTQSAADRRAEIEQDVIPYMRQLYPVAFNLTRDPGDAEDLVQETMIKTYVPSINSSRAQTSEPGCTSS